MVKINYFSLFLYMFYILFGRDFVVLKPKNILSLDDSRTLPYLWTLITSVLIETNFFAFVFHLVLANYIVYKNKEVLEKAWAPKDFILMIVLTSIMATSIHLVFRLSIYFVLKN
jgi:hypothetical protein